MYICYFFVILLNYILSCFTIPVLLNGTAGHGANNSISFSTAKYNQKYISEEELNNLIEKNKLIYRYFYCYDSRDQVLRDHIYTVNMPDFKEFGEFYSFVSSVYSSGTAEELFNDFQGNGRSFFEEDGLFLVDQSVTFTATSSLYSPYDRVRILSGNEREIMLFYWFAFPQRINVNGTVVFDSFGVKIPIVKVNDEWKLTRMIRTNWHSDDAVFDWQVTECCDFFSPTLRIATSIIKWRQELYRQMII